MMKGMYYVSTTFKLSFINLIEYYYQNLFTFYIYLMVQKLFN